MAESAIAYLESSLTAIKEARDCEDYAAGVSGEGDVPNTPEMHDDFSALIGYFQNVSEIGQATAMTEAIFDQVAYNRTVMELEKQPGEYFGDYADALRSDINDNKDFANLVLAAAKRIEVTQDNATWQQSRSDSMHTRFDELVEKLRTGALL